MTEYLDLAPDWSLRTNIALFLLNEVCRCHLYTNNGTCVRCGIVRDMREHWPTEWNLACQAYAEAKSKERTGN